MVFTKNTIKNAVQIKYMQVNKNQNIQEIMDFLLKQKFRVLSYNICKNEMHLPSYMYELIEKPIDWGKNILIIFTIKT